MGISQIELSKRNLRYVRSLLSKLDTSAVNAFEKQSVLYASSVVLAQALVTDLRRYLTEAGLTAYGLSSTSAPSPFDEHTSPLVDDLYTLYSQLRDIDNVPSFYSDDVFHQLICMALSHSCSLASWITLCSQVASEAMVSDVGDYAGESIGSSESRPSGPSSSLIASSVTVDHVITWFGEHWSKVEPSVFVSYIDDMLKYYSNKEAMDIEY